VLESVQDGAQAPATHFSVGAHCALDVQPPAWGWHAPFTHCVPEGHVSPFSQSPTHLPSAHTFPAPHSLEYLQVFDAAVHAPPEQTSPVVQSALLVQGQGPFVPPQATHLLPMQAPPAQSAFVVHSSGVGTGSVGARHVPDLQTVPLGHVASDWQMTTHPFSVQIWPCGQLELPVHLVGVGGGTGLQP
jgi:hypothetical protein